MDKKFLRKIAILALVLMAAYNGMQIYNGFHNMDLAFNIAHCPTCFDTASDWNQYSPKELYITGASQLLFHINFLVGVVAVAGFLIARE